MASQNVPRIVIVGAGFGGLACAQALAGAPAHVTVIDRHNYHLFVPLLYQVATATLSPADIARPIRRILGRARNIEVVLADVTSIDLAARAVMTADGARFPYDHLVIATGSDYSYFGHPEWSRFAVGPRSLEQARRIRTQLLTAFEAAERTPDRQTRDILMTTMIVGGGPTGVEMAGSVAELARYALARDFRNIDPRQARIVLIEAGERLLQAFPPSLSAYARRALEDLGVTVMLGAHVDEINAEGVVIDGALQRAGTVIWGAGVEASPAGQWLGVPVDRARRIAVAPDLSVKGLNGVYVIGDTAACQDEKGHRLPALAQVAAQQGRHLGRGLAAHLRTGRPLAPFRFKNRGNTAIIGRHAAVFDFGRWRLKGRLAWFLWAIVHVYLLIGFANRLLVATQWAWFYLTFERGARLITPSAEDRP